MAEAEAEIEKLKGLYEGKSMSECFARLHYRTENSIVEIRKEVKEMKEEFDNLKQYAENIDEAVKDINEKTIENLKTQLSDETKKRLELEQWSRKWNVIIRGIEGQLDESPAVTESKVREFMVNVLKLPKTTVYGSVSSSVGKSNGPSVDSSDNSAGGPSEEDTGDTGDSTSGAKNVAASGSSDVESLPMLFQAIHRLPSGGEGKRNIIARFLNLGDRDIVVRAAYKLPRGQGYGVWPDLNPEASQLRARLLADRRELRVEDKRRTKLIYMKTHPFVALKTF